MSTISPIKLSLARAVGALSRSSGRGGGTSLPGKVLLKLEPDAIAQLSSRLGRGSIVISATNGKTTTASLVASILRRADLRPVHNHAGANMLGGVASALLAEKTLADGADAENAIGLFEVDEAYAASIVEQTDSEVVVLANLFRDQLDRYGELELLADSWSAMIEALPADTTVVLNADDPLLANLCPDRQNTIYFGIEAEDYAENTLRHAADSKFCRNCGHPLSYSSIQFGHLGKYRCENCGLKRPAPDVSVSAIEMRGMAGSQIAIQMPDGEVSAELPIPGLYNVYNAVAATAVAYALGISPGITAGGLAAARAVFGRVETIDVSGHSVAILLIKNPTGANEVLRTITSEHGPIDLWIALNDKTADGHDVSWIWDADFEQLAGNVRRVGCSGTRAEELALRLAYAGIDRVSIDVDKQIERSFDRAVAEAISVAAPIFALPTYTALLELRGAIARRGDAPIYWEQG